MKKIAVISGGLLPLPSVKGGAIETLLQYVIDANEEEKHFDLEIFSIYDEKAYNESKKYNNTKYNYIKVSNIINKIYYNSCRVARKLGNSDPNFQKLYIDKVCENLKGKNYDLILIESDNHFVLPVKKVTNSKIVLYLHNDKLNVSTKYASNIIESCNHILTVSNYIKNQVLTIDSKYENKVDAILNGIDTSKFNIENKEEERNKYRNKYNLKADDFVFLFAGRVEPNKGVLELVQAFNKIKDERAKLLITGGSFFSSNHKTRYVKKLEQEIGKNKNIIVTGYIKYDEIPKYHALSDVMVSPSQWEEPGSLVNQEAFASGLPLISSYSGGTPEYAKDTQAILIKKGDKFVDDLCSAMVLVMNDNKLQKTMSDSEKKVSPYFSKERYCKDIIKYLEEVTK